MDKMISTKALHGDYLAHARVYSHKYISREPNGHGGWIYRYPTDIYDSPSYSIAVPHDGKRKHYVSYTRGDKKTDWAFASTNRWKDENSDPIANQAGTKWRTANYMREADKASQIYKEGQSESNLNEENYYKPKDPTKFQQTISLITQTAKSTIDSGKKFLSSIFTNPITETYTIKDTNNKVIASGTRNSNLSEVGKDLVNAGKKWLSNIITTKKTITITDK